MSSVSHTPDQQTRNAVTRRVTGHVTAGWPRLGEPPVRHRGQYCYVAVTLPGHREPTPILRLRCQGSVGNWAIAIYNASTGQYSETELPGSFGSATGTPEQGIDDTFTLYAAVENDCSVLVAAPDGRSRPTSAATTDGGKKHHVRPTLR